MTHHLQEFIHAAEDYREKSERLTESIEQSSVLLSDDSAEKEGQRNTVLTILCRQAVEAKAAGKVMEATMQTVKRELSALKDRQHHQHKEMHQTKEQGRGEER